MEFIKMGKNYLIKNSGGKIISEKEKLELERKELIYKDITSNECQGKTTQVLTENKNKLEELVKEEYKEMLEDISKTFTEKELKDDFKEKFDSILEERALSDKTEEKNEEHKVVEIKKPRKKRNKK